MPVTRVRIHLSPLDASLLERRTDGATRARVGPTVPPVAHAAGRARGAFGENGIRALVHGPPPSPEDS